MTKVLDLDENLLLQATKITGVENLNVLMQIALNEFVRAHASEVSLVDGCTKSNGKLSEKLLGCISKENYEIMKTELSEMRNEWERNIY